LDTPLLSVQNLQLIRHTGGLGAGGMVYRVSLESLELAPAQVVAITGPSGCGKSTLIEGLGLILRPASLGSYVLRGQEIAPWVTGNTVQWRLGSLRSRYLGIVPQVGGLLPYLTVAQNITLPIRMLGQPVQSQWIEGLAGQLGLGNLLSRYPQELSIGQRQRASLLRALAHRPDILLADEPTAALDPENARQLVELMIGFSSQFGTAVVLVTHEWSLVETFGIDRLQAKSLGPSHMGFA